MTQQKYKILQSSIEDSSIAYMPDKAIPLGITTLPETINPPPSLNVTAPPPPVTIYKNYLAFMMRYEDWEEEFPKDAALVKQGGKTDVQ